MPKKNNPEYPACWQDFYDVLNGGVNNIILYGPPGTGKTYAGLHIGSVEAGSHRLLCTENMTEFDVIGGWMPNGKGTWSWHEGAAVKAWQGDGTNGGRLVIDEIDKASGDVLALLLAFTDSLDSAEWQHPETGKILTPKPGYSVIMTTNLEQMSELPIALRDRFPVAVRINQPHPDAIAKLPVRWQPYAVRMADAGESSISLRAFYAIAELAGNLGDARAAELVLGTRRAKAFLDAIAIDRVA